MEKEQAAIVELFLKGKTQSEIMFSKYLVNLERIQTL